MRHAYSIYYGDDVIPVTLRFHPQVTRRVLETHWRTAREPEWDAELPGYLRVTFEVADTTDLKPWIRTLGANCEVLEPRELALTDAMGLQPGDITVTRTGLVIGFVNKPPSVSE